MCVVFKDDLKKQKTSLICFAWEKGILVFCSVSVCVLKCASLSVRRSVCSICVQRTGGLLLGCSVFFFSCQSKCFKEKVFKLVAVGLQ